jgi:hypothetical protein
MNGQTWVLTNAGDDAVNDSIVITSDSRPAVRGAWKIKKSILRGGLSDGVELVEIDNGRMRIFILPTRGMSVWKIDLGEEVLGWRSPVRGPVHPKFVPIFDPNGLGWLDGFDELIVRCGLESNGAPEFDNQGKLMYPVHGRIGNKPAHFVDVTVHDAGTIQLRGIVEETRFHFQKLRLETIITTSIGSTDLKIDDRVENFGGTPAEMQLLYHVNIGEPVLRPGDQLVAPVKAIHKRDNPAVDQHTDWDVYGLPIAGQAEECFYMELFSDNNCRSEVLLKGADGSRGTSLSYGAKTLPCFSLWKNMVHSADGYVTGLEPGTNYPNTRTHEAENGRVVKLDPSETWSAQLLLRAALSIEGVEQAESRIRQMHV